MTTYVRSYNPIWVFRDAAGNALDDTYYIFFLEPDLPYLPKEVYRDSAGNIAVTDPLQLRANGSMPPDIFFSRNATYRIEIRAGNSQSDQLVDKIDRYIVGSQGDGSGDSNGGGGGDDIVDLLPDNMLTNPQFNEVNFMTTTTISSAGTTSIAPGWDIVTSGAGSVVVTHTEYAGTDNVSTNPVPPYTIKLAVTGFNSVDFRQRFNDNGALWQRRAAAFTGTFTTTTASEQIVVTYEPNVGTPVSLLSDITVAGVFTELLGANNIPQSTNNTLSGSAYVDIVIAIPTEATTEFGNLQLLPQDEPLEVSFKENTVERDIDHTFHLYRAGLVGGEGSGSSNLLTGWNFANNPWQFTTTATTTLTSQCAYTADQTIIYQRAGGSQISTEQASNTNLFAFTVTAVTGDNQFAMIQYIDPATMRGWWGRTLSSLVKVRFNTTHSTSLRLKARLIHRTSLPSTIGAAEPISSWSSGGDPTFAAGWTAVTPLNDPINTLTSDNTLSYIFEDMASVNSTNDDMTLGIVLYTIDDMDESATADNVMFDTVSLLASDTAAEGPQLTFDEDLRRCQFYYEKSYELGTLPGTTTDVGRYINLFRWTAGAGSICSPFWLDFKEQKRALPTMKFYSPDAGTADRIDAGSLAVSTPAWDPGQPTQVDVSLFSQNALSTTRVFYQLNGSPGFNGSSSPVTLQTFHYEAKARLGLD